MELELEVELYGSKIKNFTIFSKKKVFLIFQEMKLSSPQFKKLLAYSGGKFLSAKNKKSPL